MPAAENGVTEQMPKPRDSEEELDAVEDEQGFAKSEKASQGTCLRSSKSRCPSIVSRAIKYPIDQRLPDYGRIESENKDLCEV